MARPEKIGLDYYPMDVGFLRNKKVRLLRAEFGASSVLFVLYVLGKAYEEEGYFLKWDKDEALTASVELQKSPAYIGEVLQGCLSRSLFDERVFQMFGVLTSPGIQRRYIRGCENRDAIRIIKEYWLLDNNSKKDVPAGILGKCAFFSVSSEKTNVKPGETIVKRPGNPQSKEKKSKVNQSKVKKSKVKESERESDALSHPPTPAVWKPTLPEGTETRFSGQALAAITDWLTYKHEKRQDYKPTGMKSVLTQIEKKIIEFGEAAVIDVIQLSMANNWHGIIWDRIKPTTGKGATTNGNHPKGNSQNGDDSTEKRDSLGLQVL